MPGVCSGLFQELSEPDIMCQLYLTLANIWEDIITFMCISQRIGLKIIRYLIKFANLNILLILPQTSKARNRQLCRFYYPYLSQPPSAFNLLRLDKGNRDENAGPNFFNPNLYVLVYTTCVYLNFLCIPECTCVCLSVPVCT